MVKNGLVSRVVTTLWKKKKNELTKKETLSIDWNMKKKILCFCKNLYKNFQGQHLNKTDDVLSGIKSEKENIKRELVENYKKLDEEVEQHYHSKTPRGENRIGLDSKIIKKRMAYYDRYYEKKKQIIMTECFVFYLL